MKVKSIIVTIIICAVATVTAQIVTPPWSKIEILFAGDLMQHESQLNAARTADKRYSYSPCYDYIRREISNADIAIANLETTIGTGNYGGYPSFCAPDSFLYAAKGTGFDILLFANNHCLDRGKRGALHTLHMLDSLGITHCGVYRDSADRKQRYPLIVEKKGTRIAILNYTYGLNGIPVPPPLVVNLIDEKVIAKDIAEAKKHKPHTIIACMHWGDEYVSLPPQRIKELADWLLEQGVDHIIGNHPHVIQPIELRFNKERCNYNTVVYSTGNLLSNMSLRRTDGGVIIGMELTKILNYTRVSSLGYMLTWIAPKKDDGTRDFTIYPAATTVIECNQRAKEKLQLFLNDSHALFENYNKGDIKELFTDSVKFTP